MEQTPGQTSAPILEAIEEYHRLDRYGFTPPGHRQGRGVDRRTLDALGLDTFRSDLLATAGLDDRLSRGAVISTALPPREAFFGPVDSVPIADAVGRIAAEQVTPYPPGIPALLPGERINAAVIEYLRTGVEAGMNLPDPADPSFETIRVVVE